MIFFYSMLFYNSQIFYSQKKNTALIMKENINVIFCKRQSIKPCLGYKFHCEFHHSPLHMRLWVTRVTSLNVSLRSASLTPAGLLCFPSTHRLALTPQVGTSMQCPNVPISSVVVHKTNTHLAQKNLDPSSELCEHVLLFLHLTM